jgi:hypothetical protein
VYWLYKSIANQRANQFSGKTWLEAKRSLTPNYGQKLVIQELALGKLAYCCLQPKLRRHC